MLGLLAAVPVVGGLLGIPAPEETEAAGRRKRRKKAHKHGKDRRRKHKRKKKCTPESVAQTCAGKCGSVQNNCKQTVDCGSCTCTPITACPAGKECGTIPDGCGGVVHCPFFCANPTPICTDNVCAACTGSDQCASGEACDGGICKTSCTTTADCGVDEVCDTGLCEPCDVCANGCAAEEIQAAIEAASSGDTVRICAGTYGRGAGSSVARISKNLRLAGAGADATILDGGDTVQVLQIGNVAVTLQDLTVTEGYGDEGGGIFNYFSGTVTMQTGSRVTDNTADNQGGGITGKATLRTGSYVTGNSAKYGGGGFDAASGSVTVDLGAVVCGNTPLNDQCGGSFTGTCPAPGQTCP